MNDNNNTSDNNNSKEKEAEANNTENRPANDVHRRPVITEKFMEETYKYDKLKHDNVVRATGHYLKKYYRPSANCMQSFCLKRFPIIDWILNYDMKQYFVKDLIAGLTLGIVHIPQGMAYSMMAGTPAINGLYVSFFTIALYIFFGTSRHLSVGTYAIISLLVRSSLEKYKGILYPAIDATVLSSSNITTTTTTTTHATMHHRADSHSSSHSSMEPIGFISNNPEEAKVFIAGALALFSGVFQIILAILHVGCVTKYLSDAIVNGFVVGAAYHVVISQIPSLLGIKLGEEHMPFVIIGELIQIAKHIGETKPATVVISIIACIFLYVIKVHVNEKFKKVLPAPIPAELIAVVIGTVASYLIKVNKKYEVDIIGKLPLGLPSPRLPPLKLFSVLIGDSITIGIVSFAINVSMAKMFAKKYKYEIRPNQELFSYGIGNVVVSFFRGFPGCVGLSRCVILESVGGKTQAHGIYSCILVLVVALFLGPLFRDLPKAVLASIIVIALKTMVLEVKTIVPLFKKSKIEGLGWLITFLGVMILNVDVGLYIGLIVSILIVIIKAQRARTSIMGIIPGTNIYECIDSCNNAKELKGMRIIRYEESVYYVNVDNFKYKVFKLSKINPDEIKAKISSETKREIQHFLKLVKQHKDNEKKENKTVANLENGDFDPKQDIEETKKRISEKIRNKHLDEIENKQIILDCSCMNYIDSQGVDCILKLHESFKEFGVNLYLSYCKQAVIKAFKKNSLETSFDFDRIFLSTHEAVLYVLSVFRPDVKIVQNTDPNSKNQIVGSEFFEISILKETNIEAKTDQDEYFTYNF